MKFDEVLDDILLEFVHTKLDLYKKLNQPDVNRTLKSMWYSEYQKDTGTLDHTRQHSYNVNRVVACGARRICEFCPFWELPRPSRSVNRVRFLMIDGTVTVGPNADFGDTDWRIYL